MARTPKTAQVKSAPRYGSTYYTIAGNDGLTVLTRTWTGDQYDRGRLRVNNVFTDINVAKKIRDAQEAQLAHLG